MSLEQPKGWRWAAERDVSRTGWDGTGQDGLGWAEHCCLGARTHGAGSSEGEDDEEEAARPLTPPAPQHFGTI